MKLVACALALVAAASGIPRAAACGIADVDVAFFPERGPATPRERFDRGELGIVGTRWGVDDLWVTWRTLSGNGLDARTAEWLRSRPAHDGPVPESGRAAWVEANASLGRIVPLPDDSPRRAVRRDGGSTTHVWYDDCLDDAFRTAARTLVDRAATWGAGSAELARWLEAQEQVFSHCESAGTIPGAADASWSALERRDRAYQRAAALFYAERYAEAESAFAAIAGDRESPWSDLGAYLVARTQLRRGDVGGEAPGEQLARVERTVADLLRDPSRAQVHAAARRTLQRARAVLDPAAALERVAGVLQGAGAADAPHQALVDFRALFLTAPATADAGDMTTWIRLMRGPRADGAMVALARWRETGSVPWLVAAMAARSPGDAVAEDVVEAARAVPRTSPAWPTVAFHLTDLHLAAGEPSSALLLADELLAREPQLALGDANRVRTLAARASPTLEEAVRRAVQRPVLTVQGADSWPPGPDELGPWLEHGFAKTLDGAASAARLAEASHAVEAPHLKRHLLEAAWTRAVLLDDAVADEIATELAGLAPDLRPGLEAWRSAPPERRKFRAALLLLRNPATWIRVKGGLVRASSRLPDLMRRNCSGSADPGPAPAWLPSDEMARERGRLASIPDAPHALGAIVLAHVRAHPDDPLAAEALARVVKATRYGCGARFGDVSQPAFALLHRRHGGTRWARQTPYWFD